MRYLPVVLVACVSAEPPPVKPEPVVVPAVAPKPGPPPITRIEVLGSRMIGASLCLHAATSKECLSLGFDYKTKTLTKSPFEGRWTGFSFVLDGKPCTLLYKTLSCEGRAPIVVEDHSTAHYGFLHAGDKVWWYENWLDLDAPGAGGDRVLREMRAFPGGIKQLTVVFRAACVIAGDHSAWCWGDPRQVKRATVPANTAEIFLQEPFELCARTTNGEVSCSPALAVTDLACNKGDHWCGQVPITETGSLPMRARFDPLVAILRPQQSIVLGHSATRIVRDDTDTQMHCDDTIHKVRIDPRATGGCALGPAGEVTCFAPCGSKWEAFKITGMPGVSELWVDDHTGYARTPDGTLYAWPNPQRDRQYTACTPFPAVAAKRIAELSRVAQLTAPIEVVRGPHWFEHVRCAIVDGGQPRCWQVGKDGMPANIVDPRALPAPTKR